MVVLGLFTLAGGYLAVSLLWLRLSGRLAGEPDAEGILLVFALMAAAVAILEFLIAGIGVKAGSINAWWMAAPATILVATILGLCGVDLGSI
jgi:hypothetical protein